MVPKLASLLVKNAQLLVTMDDDRREISNGGMYIEGNRIVAVGESDALPDSADEVLDLAGHLVIPGLINTHHHMYESMTRGLPQAQGVDLFSWAQALYPFWTRMTPPMVEASALTAMAQLLLSGCTTSSDHQYMFPNGVRLDDSIAAAEQIGLRFHAARGSLDVLQAAGGWAPDIVVETADVILKDTQRLIETYNDPEHFAMARIVVAPCSPFAASADLMRESAALARHYGVSMHTHLAESAGSAAYCLHRFGMTPARYAEHLGWVGPDVWHAHCVGLDADGMNLFARTGTGISHCPCTEMRLGSGIAPLREMRDLGMRVSIGVDGSASNDASHMLAELRQTLLLQRVNGGADAMAAREVLEMATLGGAQVLGRDDIGSLKPGMAADFVSFDLGQLAFAGAMHDPLASLVFCAPAQVSTSVINGRLVVCDGQLVTLELGELIDRHNRLARQLVGS